MISHHVLPRLGRYRLNALTPEVITRIWNAMTKDGLSATIVRHCHRRLSKALNDAVKRNLIDRNPCTYATTPKIQAKEIHPLDDHQIVDILTEAKDSQYHAITYIALHTGMRRGEIFDLKWFRVLILFATTSSSSC